MTVADLHPEDIKARIRKHFRSLGEFERQSGLPPFSVKDALRRPHEAAERAIADLFGTAPSVIWPSRYDRHGERLSPQPPANYGREERQAA